MDPMAETRRLAHFPDERVYIHRACTRLLESETKGELGTAIAKEITHFSMYDLQVIGGKLNREIDRLPSPYRESVRPCFHTQIFGTHHTLMMMHRSGAFTGMRESIKDPEGFRTFCNLVPDGCFQWDRGTEMHSHFYRPRHRYFR